MTISNTSKCGTVLRNISRQSKKRASFVWFHTDDLSLNCNTFLFIETTFILAQYCTHGKYISFFHLSIYPSIFDWNYQSKSAWTTFYFSYVERKKGRLEREMMFGIVILHQEFTHILRVPSTITEFFRPQFMVCRHLFIFPPFPYQVSFTFRSSP